MKSWRLRSNWKWYKYRLCIKFTQSIQWQQGYRLAFCMAWLIFFVLWVWILFYASPSKTPTQWQPEPKLLPPPPKRFSKLSFLFGSILPFLPLQLLFLLLQFLLHLLQHQRVSHHLSWVKTILRAFDCLGFVELIHWIRLDAGQMQSVQNR